MGNEKPQQCYAREYDVRNLEMAEHRRLYRGFLKWSSCNGYSGAYKIVCKASQVLQQLQPVLARIFICFIQ